jgi:hypothetical protein
LPSALATLLASARRQRTRPYLRKLVRDRRQRFMSVISGPFPGK